MKSSIAQLGGGSPTAHAQRWLLLFNCQAAGLAHCLSLQCGTLQVEFHDPASALQNEDQIAATLDLYDRILVAPALRKMFALGHRENVWDVPSIQFYSYQPDWCLFAPEFSNCAGAPFGNVHSIIAYTAFTLGLNLEEALALYRDDVYLELGYYTRWSTEAKAFYERYEQFGFDMRGSLAKWSRAGAFMYIPVHPKIECLNDLARAIVMRAGLPLTGSALLPQDNLVGGPVFPVYPDVGRRLGVAGDYLFKPGGSYRPIDMAEFVARSYRYYLQFVDRSPIHPSFAEALANARVVIAEKAGLPAPKGAIRLGE